MSLTKPSVQPHIYQFQEMYREAGGDWGTRVLSEPLKTPWRESHLANTSAGAPLQLVETLRHVCSYNTSHADDSLLFLISPIRFILFMS